MKRLTMIVAMAALLLPATAREVEVTSLRRLLQDVESPAYYPALDNAGNRLLFLSENGALKMYDMADNVTVTVTTDRVAGNDACFGGDGKVYFVTQQVGEDHLVYRTGQRFDPQTRQTARLTDPLHGTLSAVKASRGAMLKASASSFNSGNDAGSAAWVQDSRVHVVVNGQERVFSPVDSWAGYLWASLSPDGQRVAFFAAGKGIVVIDLRGQVMAMLGNYEMPCWYNDDYIVAQHATDDGHQITSSQLMLLKADGTWRAELTRPTTMTMQPTCGGGKIVYTTIDGSLHEMTINIHE